MKREYNFYLCPSCFQVYKTTHVSHQHALLSCFVGEPGDERRKPLTDAYGNYVSRAPRWYLEATGQIPAWTPVNWEKGSERIH